MMDLLNPYLTLENLLFAFTGVAAGFLSGLLSIGGGFILVPALMFIFSHFYRMDGHYAIQLILGTTMACMILTSISSTIAQNKLGSIHWEYIKKNSNFIVMGVLMGVISSGFAPTAIIKFFFGTFCIFSGLKTIFKKPAKVEIASSFDDTKAQTFFFGALCGLIGVGGANVVVPFLQKRGVELRKALGTASAFQVPVSIAGTLGYIVSGLLSPNTIGPQPGAIGYVFLPALLVISIFAVGFNRLGVRIAHSWPIAKLKLCFGVFTIFIGFYAIYKIL
jgi:uncharacterized membrane protein YfcA